MARNTRLSGMDLLPESANPVVEEVVRLIKRRRITTDDVYDVLCNGLRSIDVQAPSRTAFYRWAKRILDTSMEAPFVSRAPIADQLRNTAEQLEMLARHLRMMAGVLAGDTLESEGKGS